MKIARIAFNGGELSPSAELRADLDIYSRGCRSVLNMELGQMGGVRRRRGMAAVCPAMSDHSRLVPVTYSQDDSYIFEFYSANGEGRFRILSPEGTVQRVEAYNPPVLSRWMSPEIVRSLAVQQVNDLVYVCSEAFFPVVITRSVDASGYIWRIRHMQMKTVPSDSTGENESSLEISVDEGSRRGSAASDGLSYSKWSNATLDIGYIIVRDKVPGRGFESAEWRPEDTNWQINNNGDIGNILSGGNSSSVMSGQVLKRTISANWKVEWWRCIRAYSPANFKGSTNPYDYPEYFRLGRPWITGIQLTGGKWDLLTSGTWYASMKIVELKDGYDSFGQRIEEEIKTLFSANNRNYTTVYDDEGEGRELAVYLTESFAGQSVGKVNITRDPYPCEHVFRVTSVGANWLNVQKYDPYPMSRGTLETYDWSISACSPQTGYFRHISLHNSRLVFAGTPSKPQTIWMSAVDDLAHFRIGTNDDSPMQITLATTSQNRIQWISSQQRKLIVGTTEAEWTLSGGDKPITPTSISAERHSTVGSAAAGNLMAENAVLYTERGGKRLRRYGYSYEIDGYVSTDLTVFADHILSAGVREVGYQRSPDAVIWVVLHDGTMAAMTYNTMHNVNAWGRVTTPGGLVKSVAVIPDKSGKGDEVWVMVIRGGSPWIEVMRDGNQYRDHGQVYASEVVTNYMESISSSGESKNSTQVMVRFVEATADSVRVSNGGDWTMLSADFFGTLSGWNEITATCQWGREFCVGVRVEDDSPLSILGIKAIYNN